MHRILFAAALLLPLTAHAQQLETTRLLEVVAQQRNNAMNLHAQAEAIAAQLRDENIKLKAELEELRKKLPADEKK